MVAAKTDRAHEGLARQFAAHSIDRRYQAIVAGRARRRRRARSTRRSRRSPTNRKKMAIVATDAASAR